MVHRTEKLVGFFFFLVGGQSQSMTLTENLMFRFVPSPKIQSHHFARPWFPKGASCSLIFFLFSGRHKHSFVGQARVFGNRKPLDIKYFGCERNFGELETAHLKSIPI